MSASIQVVHGNPDDTELAVVVALVTAAASAAPPAGEQQASVSNWAQPAMRSALSTGPGAWWRSGLPRP